MDIHDEQFLIIPWGFPVLTLPDWASQDDMAAIKVLLDELREGRWDSVVLPAGYEFEWVMP